MKTTLNIDSEEAVKEIKDEAWKQDSDIPFDILESLRNGSHDAYKTIYLLWRKPIYYLLLKLTGSEQDAEDITQDVFIKLWENYHKVDPNKNIKSLLYLIARHSAAKHFDRKKARYNYGTKNEFDDTNLENSYDIVVAKEIELLKDAALARMSAQRRTIYLLSIEEGFSAAQISQKLGLSQQTVYNQLSAARKDLNDLITIFLVLFVIR